jgi:serine/threonine-protein kinase RsbT
MLVESRVALSREVDIVLARQRVREFAQTLGFGQSDLTMIATAVSEMARNVIRYAERGELTVGSLERAGRRGLVVVTEDEGPGIDDVEEAPRDGYSTGGTLGLGLPEVKRLMDEFEIHSQSGRGTAVTATKWVP